MNSLVFAEDESADSTWSPPSDDCYRFNSIQTNLTRTNSELRFEKFMKEFSASTSAAEPVYKPPVINTDSDSPPNFDLTPEEWEEAVKFADGCLVSDPDESKSDVNSVVSMVETMLLSKELVLRPLDLPPLDSDSLRGYLINQLQRSCASVAQRWRRSEPPTANGKRLFFIFYFFLFNEFFYLWLTQSMLLYQSLFETSCIALLCTSVFLCCLWLERLGLYFLALLRK